MMDAQQNEKLKKAAAEHAVDNYITSGMTIGLGTGSTMYYCIQKIGHLYSEEMLQNIICLSTSAQTTEQMQRCKIPTAEYKEILSQRKLDIAIDGADFINRRGDLIKGGGGALTREKIIAYNSEEFIVVGDARKRVPSFAVGVALPVEVLEIAKESVSRELLAMRYRATPLFQKVRVRTHGQPSMVYKSDNGNVIIDAYLNIPLHNAHKLEYRINAIAGIVENGFFTQKRATIIIASKNGIRIY